MEKFPEDLVECGELLSGQREPKYPNEPYHARETLEEYARFFRDLDDAIDLRLEQLPKLQPES